MARDSFECEDCGSRDASERPGGIYLCDSCFVSEPIEGLAITDTLDLDELDYTICEHGLIARSCGHCRDRERDNAEG